MYLMEKTFCRRNYKWKRIGHNCFDVYGTGSLLVEILQVSNLYNLPYFRVSFPFGISIFHKVFLPISFSIGNIWIVGAMRKLSTFQFYFLKGITTQHHWVGKLDLYMMQGWVEKWKDIKSKRGWFCSPASAFLALHDNFSSNAVCAYTNFKMVL